MATGEVGHLGAAAHKPVEEEPRAGPVFVTAQHRLMVALHVLAAAVNRKLVTLKPAQFPVRLSFSSRVRCAQYIDDNGMGNNFSEH